MGIAIESAVAATEVDRGIVGTDFLLKELGRRGFDVQLQAAIGAMHDHLDRIGALDSESKMTAYLVYRLRREGSLASASLPTEERRKTAAIWQEKIDNL